MLNRISYILLLGLLTLCAFLYINFAQTEMPPARSVGTERCRTCHEAASFGDQFAIWQQSAHSRAYTLLSTDSAKKILATGRTIESCLGCHSTLGRPAANPAEAPLLEEGVGCERCHGPGSNYSDFNTMIDRERFTSRGGVTGSLEDCHQCHSRQSGGDACPFERTSFNADSAWKRIAHPATRKRTNDTLLKMKIR